VVKIKRWDVGEIFGWVEFYHFPYYNPEGGPTWHLVHEYTGDIYWYMAITNWSYGPFLPDQETARLCALNLQSLSQVVTDMCPICHPSGFQFYGPLHFPRYNIYRGKRGEPLVPCFYWDIFNPDPPQGFNWEYPYPFPPWEP
jgi:hypothetical protein